MPEPEPQNDSIIDVEERLTTPDMPDIDWENKNFPPCFPKMHFDLHALEGRFKTFCQRCYWGFVTITLYTILNIIMNMFQFAFKRSSTMRFIFSLTVNPFLMVTSFYCFYIGYKAVVYDNKKLKLYMIIELVLLTICVCAFVFDLLNFDGIIRLVDVFKRKHYIFGISIFFELTVLGFGIFTRIMCLIQAFTWRKKQVLDSGLTADDK